MSSPLPRQRVVLEVAPSGVRALAGLIDMIPVAAFTALAWWLGAGSPAALIPDELAFWPEHIGDTWNANPMTFVHPLLVPVTLAILWTSIWQTAAGTTPGKWALKLDLVDDHGRLADGRQLLLRFGGYLASTATLGFGWLLALIVPTRRTLHDMLSHTWVVVGEQ